MKNYLVHNFSRAHLQASAILSLASASVVYKLSVDLNDVLL